MSVNMPDFIYGVTSGDMVYDIETYPNAFTVGLEHQTTKQRWFFEISFRRNDIEQFCVFLDVLAQQRCRMVGYNNIGFDYPVIHFIYKYRHAFVGLTEIYNKAMDIISAHGNARFAHMVWESDWVVNQLDLYKIHHFDNMSKATSLKVLEFNMRMQSIEDLPFPVGTELTVEQLDMLIEYMWHDIKATSMFYNRTQSHIKLRTDLSKQYNKNMMNMSDVKMGETILVSEMHNHGVDCFEYIDNKKVKKQTKRESIDLGAVVFDYVNFEHPEFQRIKCYIESKVITETKGVFKELIATIDGLEYKFGTGGLHMSVDSQIIHSTHTHQLIDVDVASFYPKMAIENKMYPEHLGEAFCIAYNGIYITRRSFEKGTPENEAFKLALNGAFGGANNDYSPFLDAAYAMGITVNGQLLLCMLIEQLIKVPGLRMIQANTDGVTYLCPHEYIDHTRSLCRWWEGVTKLELEEVLYNRMFIRDVNNYIAEYNNGKLKRIGAYAHVTAEDNPGTRELPHHKNWSARIVALGAEAVLVRGESANDFISNHDDIFNFFLRTKVPRSSSLEWGGEKVDNIVRYYISNTGRELEKVMPAAGVDGEFKRANKLTDQYFNEVMREVGASVWDDRIHTKNKSTYQERRTAVQSGYSVNLCNRIPDCIFDSNYINDNGDDGGDIAEHESWFNDINVNWYIKEIEKITKPLLNGSM